MKSRVEKSIKTMVSMNFMMILCIILLFVLNNNRPEDIMSYIAIFLVIIGTILTFVSTIPRILKIKKLHNALVAEIKGKREIYYACIADLMNAENVFNKTIGILYFTEAGFEWYEVRAYSNKSRNVYVPLDNIVSFETKKSRMTNCICLKTEDNDFVFAIENDIKYSEEIKDIYNEKVLKIKETAEEQ